MSKQTVDINDILASNKLELVLKEKLYIIKDIPMEVFLQSQKTPSDNSDIKSVLHHQLALVLDVDVEELQDLGVRAVTIALAEIRKWVMQPIDEDISGNP